VLGPEVAPFDKVNILFAFCVVAPFANDSFDFPFFIDFSIMADDHIE
jgi:hypothetical protein